MSISMNTSQMEALTNFGYFLEIIKDPKALMAVVDEAKKVLAENEKQLGIVNTKKAADAYLENAKATVGQWSVEDVAKQAKFDAKMSKAEADLAERTARVEALASEATTSAKEAKAKLEQAKQESLAAGDAAFKATVLLNNAEIKTKEIQLKEKELDEKLATVKKMLGE